jgi:hypothetical protein
MFSGTQPRARNITRDPIDGLINSRVNSLKIYRYCIFVLKNSIN